MFSYKKIGENNSAISNSEDSPFSLLLWCSAFVRSPYPTSPYGICYKRRTKDQRFNVHYCNNNVPNLECDVLRGVLQ